jgi:hypothetical protein
LSLLIFPIAVAVVSGLLIRFGYGRPGGINRIFAEYSRPPRLKTTITLWLAGLVVVFVFVQWLRFPYYSEFLSRLSHLRARTRDPFELMIVAGLLVMLICECVVVIHWMVYIAYCWIGATK